MDRGTMPSSFKNIKVGAVVISLTKPFTAPPTIVNFFYHEKIKKSGKANA